MIIFSALLASLSIGQTAIITTHQLGATWASPTQRTQVGGTTTTSGAATFYDAPLGSLDCGNPTPLQVSYNRSAYPQGSIAIYLVQSASCVVSTLPSGSGALLNTSLGSLQPTINYFPTAGIDASILSTNMVMALGGWCGERATPINLADATLCIAVQPTTSTTTTFVYDQLQFRVDTQKPLRVGGVTVTPGNGHLSVSFTEDTSDASLKDYLIVVEDPDGNKVGVSTSPLKGTTHAEVSGLSNGVQYSVTVYARDIAGNISDVSTPVSAKPVDTCDFWSCYEGREKGGFCFIATAAYGSYDAPFVQTFRDFRDRILMKSLPGRAFVAWYYKHGAAPARFIAAHSWARHLSAAMLVFPYIAVWPLVHVQPFVWGFLGLLLLALAALLVRRLRAASVLVLMLCLSAGTARAEREELLHDDPNDPSAVRVPPPRFEVSFKVGPYFPAIDKDPQTLGYYGAYFGKTDKGLFSPGARARIEATADVYFLQKYGLLGISGSGGFFTAAGKARVCSQASDCSTAEQIASAPLASDSTVFNLFPVAASIVYKLDILWRKFKVPLVPYARAGVDAVFWNAQSAGKQARKAGSVYNRSLQPNGFAQGVTFGWHVNPGIAVALDWIEPNAARSAYTFTGVKGSYLVFEWQFMQVDDFSSSKSWDLSASTFKAGLAVEF